MTYDPCATSLRSSLQSIITKTQRLSQLMFTMACYLSIFFAQLIRRFYQYIIHVSKSCKEAVMVSIIVSIIFLLKTMSPVYMVDIFRSFELYSGKIKRNQYNFWLSTFCYQLAQFLVLSGSLGSLLNYQAFSSFHQQPIHQRSDNCLSQQCVCVVYNPSKIYSLTRWDMIVILQCSSSLELHATRPSATPFNGTISHWEQWHRQYRTAI